MANPQIKLEFSMPSVVIAGDIESVLQLAKTEADGTPIYGPLAVFICVNKIPIAINLTAAANAEYHHFLSVPIREKAKYLWKIIYNIYPTYARTMTEEVAGFIIGKNHGNSLGIAKNFFNRICKDFTFFSRAVMADELMKLVHPSRIQNLEEKNMEVIVGKTDVPNKKGMVYSKEAMEKVIDKFYKNRKSSEMRKENKDMLNNPDVNSTVKNMHHKNNDVKTLIENIKKELEECDTVAASNKILEFASEHYDDYRDFMFGILLSLLVDAKDNKFRTGTYVGTEIKKLFPSELASLLLSIYLGSSILMKEDDSVIHNFTASIMSSMGERIKENIFKKKQEMLKHHANDYDALLIIKGKY